MAETATKRQKELMRLTKRKEKAARRLERKEQKARRGLRPEGEDPDIAGIRPGPQPELF